MVHMRVPKPLRRVLSIGLVAFATFRFFELMAGLISDPSGTTLAADEGVPLPLALAIRAALPIHLSSVALLLQRHALPPPWGRIGWHATVITGSWLGVTLLLRWFL
jgi:hypothetical protein